jgi:hypothetical protein
MLCIYSITPWVIFQKKRVRLKSNRLITLYSLSYLSLLVQLHLLYHDAQIISMTFSHFPSFQLIYTIILYFLFVIMHYSCVFSTNIFSYFINIPVVFLTN